MRILLLLFFTFISIKGLCQALPASMIGTKKEDVALVMQNRSATLERKKYYDDGLLLYDYLLKENRSSDNIIYNKIHRIYLIFDNENICISCQYWFQNENDLEEIIDSIKSNDANKKILDELTWVDKLKKLKITIFRKENVKGFLLQYSYY